MLTHAAARLGLFVFMIVGVHSEGAAAYPFSACSNRQPFVSKFTKGYAYLFSISTPFDCTSLAVFLHFREHEEVSGVMFYMPMYFFYVLVSIPTFFLIRRFYGWTFLSCSVAALLVVIVTEVVTFASTSEDPFSFTRSGSLVLLQP